MGANALHDGSSDGSVDATLSNTSADSEVALLPPLGAPAVLHKPKILLLTQNRLVGAISNQQNGVVKVITLAIAEACVPNTTVVELHRGA